MKKVMLLAGSLVWLSFSSLFAQNTWSSFVDSVNCFSSPRVAELTGDEVLDIVVGAGLEDSVRNNGVLAFDGASGELLWHVNGRNQMYGSAIFYDITDDGTPEVFIGGRQAQLYAINGKTGTLEWEFYPEGDTVDPGETANLYNFYNPQLIPDQNGDGYQDLIVANGGDKFAGPLDTDRPTGNLMVISSKDGAEIAKTEVPDGHETYMSALVHDFEADGIMEVIFGSGGETLGGSLWKGLVADVLDNDLSGSVQLLDGGEKGMIAPPSLADFNRDGIKDIMINAYDNKAVAIDGADNTVLWEVELPGTETIVTPAIGQFTADSIPDVFTIFGAGVAPSFFDFIQLMIDGATGEVLFQDTIGFWSFASPVAFDYDADGYDEALFCISDIVAPAFYHQLLLVDFNDDEIVQMTDFEGGSNLASTPWVGDLDNDGMLEIVYAHNADSTAFFSEKGFVMERIDLAAQAPESIAWGAYMGTNYDGIYEPDFSTGIEENSAFPGLEIYPNPADGTFTINLLQTNASKVLIRIYNSEGKLVYRQKSSFSNGSIQHFVDLQEQPAGVYFVELQAGSEKLSRKVVVR